MEPPISAPPAGEQTAVPGGPQPSPSSRATAPEAVEVIVPDYSLLQRVGAGSYGEVWLARSKATGALRAAKIVWRRTFEDERPFTREFEGIQRFERISREHPSQLALFHIGRNDKEGYFYYIMELADPAPSPNVENRNPKEIRPPNAEASTPTDDSQVSGFGVPSEFGLRNSDLYSPHTLRSELANGRLPAPRVLEIGLALTEALSHLHSHGLVHRDVKPSNVIFVNGRPKLADIGLVTDASDTCSIVGTEGYLPPEGPGTPQADLFALGKVLYEASTGMDRRRFSELPEDLRSWPDRAGVIEFNEIVLKACAKDPAKRYRSATEMGDDLALLQGGRSVKRQRAWERSLSYAKKGVLTVGTLAAVSAIILTLPVWKSRAPAVEWSRNEEANDAYRNGLLAFHTGSGDGLLQGLKLFEKAVDLDTNFAAAYACLAGAYNWTDPNNPEVVKKARRAAEKALSLNNKLDDAIRAVGWSKALLDHDWAGAEKEYQRAVRLGPNSEGNLYGYANLLVTEGRARDAVQLVEKALRLDSRSILFLQNAGLVFLYNHQYDQAIQKFEQVLKKEPSSRPRLAPFLATAWRETGDYPKAIQIEEEAASLRGENRDQMKTRFDTLREAYDRGGPKAYWQQKLDWSGTDDGFIMSGFGSLDRLQRRSPVWLAALCARVGDKGMAFHYLDLAFNQVPTQLTRELNREPSFDSLRADRRFADVLKRLGLLK